MAPEIPDNADLVQLIGALNEASQDELEPRLKSVLRRLVGATLITEREASTIDSEDDETFLALFTDPVELHFFEPGAQWRPIGADDALQRVARGDYDGLVINPGRRQLELSRDDVTDFFDIDT